MMVYLRHTTVHERNLTKSVTFKLYLPLLFILRTRLEQSQANHTFRITDKLDLWIIVYGKTAT